MDVRGAAIVSLQSFVLSNYGADDYKIWLNSLSEESRAIMSKRVELDEWYPLLPSLHEPTKKICDLFFKEKLTGAWEAGRYSADFGFNTLMKVFLKVASVSFVVRRASVILPRYYEPCTLRIIENRQNGAVLHIEEFPEITEVIEHRIGGWMQRAVELTGGRDAQVNITRSLTRAYPHTEFVVTWK